MTTRRYLSVPRGADFEADFYWETPDGPVDLTGWSVQLAAFGVNDPATTVLDLTDLAGLTLDRPAGHIAMPLSASTTTDLPDLLVYSITVTPAEGDALELVRGTIEVSEAANPQPPLPIQTISATSGVLFIPGPQGDTGATGPAGPQGPKGDNGADGAGVPAGGISGQVLTKQSGTDHDTDWATPAAGSGIVIASTIGGLTPSTLEAETTVVGGNGPGGL